MSNNDFNVGAWAMVHWIYNTSGVRFAEIAYGADQHPDYLDEKASLWVKSPTRALGYLDSERRTRVLAAIREYEQHVKQELS